MLRRGPRTSWPPLAPGKTYTGFRSNVILRRCAARAKDASALKTLSVKEIRQSFQVARVLEEGSETFDDV